MIKSLIRKKKNFLNYKINLIEKMLNYKIIYSRIEKINLAFGFFHYFFFLTISQFFSLYYLLFEKFLIFFVYFLVFSLIFYLV